MTHTERATLLLAWLCEESRAIDHRDIILFDEALGEHIADYEAVVDTGCFEFCGDTYRNKAGTQSNPHLMDGLVLFAYARESLRAQSEQTETSQEPTCTAMLFT